jgi:Na+/alanine symporter
MNFPNYKKGLRWGLSCGFVFALLWFAACYFFSKLPAASDVSISLALQPSWKQWLAGVLIFIVAALVIGILAALRPNLSKRSHQFSKH